MKEFSNQATFVCGSFFGICENNKPNPALFAVLAQVAEYMNYVKLKTSVGYLERLMSASQRQKWRSEFMSKLPHTTLKFSRKDVPRNGKFSE